MRQDDCYTGTGGDLDMSIEWRLSQCIHVRSMRQLCLELTHCMNMETLLDCIDLS